MYLQKWKLQYGKFRYMEKIHLPSFSRAEATFKLWKYGITKFMELKFYFLSARACISATKLARTEEKCVGEF